MDLRELNVELIERLAALEQTVRRWRAIGVMIVLLLAMAVVLGAATYDAVPIFDSVRARELNILDASGRVRALIRVGQDDSVALALLDTEGHTRASLALAPNGDPRLRLYEKLERPRTGLEIGSDGAGAAALATRDGTLYFYGISQTMRELPSVEGVRLRKAVTVPDIQAAPDSAYRMVDAERLSPH